jgi:microcystin-dependent protein
MDPFVAEIRPFAFAFAPKGWATCDGQLLPLSQNTALFSLLGTYYGGDGKSNFALPDLRDATPMHQGQGGGLTPRSLGETGGTPFVTLLQTEMPAHNHTMNVSGEPSNERQPDPARYIGRGTGVSMYGPNNGSTTTLSFQALTTAGGSQPHNNMQPYLTLNLCIALQGVFPPRG